MLLSPLNSFSTENSAYSVFPHILYRGTPINTGVGVATLNKVVNSPFTSGLDQYDLSSVAEYKKYEITIKFAAKGIADDGGGSDANYGILGESSYLTPLDENFFSAGPVGFGDVLFNLNTFKTPAIGNQIKIPQSVLFTYSSAFNIFSTLANAGPIDLVVQVSLFAEK